MAGDLTRESLVDAYAKIRILADEQLERRRLALQANAKPPLWDASPCLSCLKSFGKVPWRSDA